MATKVDRKNAIRLTGVETRLSVKDLQVSQSGSPAYFFHCHPTFLQNIYLSRLMRHSCSENRNRILTATVSVIYCVSVLSFTQKWIGGIHMKTILNIESLTKVYGTLPNQTRALNGITFQVMPGEFLGIMGSSGSGKSTLLNCIATVIQPTGGNIQVEGDDLQSLKGKALAEYRGKKVGYLFQNFELLDNLTGRENILLPTSLHAVSEAESSQRLRQLADYLEVTDVLDKFPSKMSGGQRQRVAAARALILHPQMILADEPTGALDSKNARSLMEKLSGLNRDEQATILMVTHDSNAASFCKRILFIQDGVIFHELRRGDESQQEFYGHILKVMAQLGGGSANVL